MLLGPSFITQAGVQVEMPVSHFGWPGTRCFCDHDHSGEPRFCGEREQVTEEELLERLQERRVASLQVPVVYVRSDHEISAGLSEEWRVGSSRRFPCVSFGAQPRLTVMFRRRSTLESRDRESGLAFSWRVPLSSAGSMALAVFLVGLGALALSAAVRVGMGRPRTEEVPRATIVVVLWIEVERIDRRRAGAGPFRFAGILQRIDYSSRNRTQEGNGRGRPLPA